MAVTYEKHLKLKSLMSYRQVFIIGIKLCFES